MDSYKPNYIPPTVTIFEAVALRPKNGETEIAPEVYLHRASSSDLWTVPRSTYIHGETDGQVALRLEKKFQAEISDFEKVCRRFNETANEPTYSNIFIVELVEKPYTDDNHGWFSAVELPMTITKFQFEVVISAALEYYKNRTLK